MTVLLASVATNHHVRAAVATHHHVRAAVATHHHVRAAVTPRPMSASDVAVMVGSLGAFLLLFGALIAVAVFAIQKFTRSRDEREQRAQGSVEELARRRATIQSGNLPQIFPEGIMPVSGEKFFYEQAAQWGQTQSQHQTKGSSPAVYIPLGHGVRARIGGYQSNTQPIANFQWGPHGTISVSNLRLAFKAHGRTELGQVPFEKINAYDLFPDGLGLSVVGLGTVQIRTGDECLGLLFKQIVTSHQLAASGEGITPQAFGH